MNIVAASTAAKIWASIRFMIGLGDWLDLSSADLVAVEKILGEGGRPLRDRPPVYSCSA